MKVLLYLCAFIVYCSGYSLTEYNYLCFDRHGDYLKHPNDCQKFIRCSHGRAYEFQCPGNLRWHQKIKSCDYIYRTKCDLSIGESSSDRDTVTVNVTEENIKKCITDNIASVENFTTNKILELSTKQITVNLTENYNGNSRVELSTELVTVLITKLSNVNFTTDNSSDLLTTQDNLHFKNQLIENFTTDNVSELTAIEDNLTTKPFTASNFIHNVLELSTEVNTVRLKESLLNNSAVFNETELSTEKTTLQLTEQLLDNTTMDYHSELSTEENTIQLTEQLLSHTTVDHVSELSTEESSEFLFNKEPVSIKITPIQLTGQILDDTTVNSVHSESSTEENIFQLTEELLNHITMDYVSELTTEENTFQLTDKSLDNNAGDKVNYVADLSVDEIPIQLTEQLFDDTTVDKTNYVPELSTEKSTIQLTDQLLKDTTADYHRELLIEENTTQLLGDNRVDYHPALSTTDNTLNLTEKIVDDIAETGKQLVNYHTDNVSKLPAQESIENSTEINIPELSTAAATKTTESKVQSNFKGNEADISRDLVDTTMIYGTETTTEIVYSHAITNNKNGKKLFSKLSHQLLTSTSTPTYSQRPPDSTTQDPRLPFRAIECQGENNRQQFKALKCYQYYQCFAGWAFLLNCHEGWWFHADMKRCIQNVDNECGY